MSSFETDTAVVIAAGVGTRDLPVSKLRGKELGELYGEPLIGHLATELAGIGIKNLVVVIGDETDAYGQNIQQQSLERWFKTSERYEAYLRANKTGDELTAALSKLDQTHGLDITYAVQPNDGRYGTAAPLWAARAHLRGVERFLVMNGDDVMYREDGGSTNRDLIETTKQLGADHGLLTKSVTKQAEGKYPYGIVSVGENGLMADFVEKPKAEAVTSDRPQANLGKYYFSSSIFRRLREYMNTSREQRAQDEFYLTDVFRDVVRSGEATMAVHTTDTRFLDAGDRDLRLLASMVLAGMPEELVAAAEAHLKASKQAGRQR